MAYLRNKLSNDIDFYFLDLWSNYTKVKPALTVFLENCDYNLILVLFLLSLKPRYNLGHIIYKINFILDNSKLYSIKYITMNYTHTKSSLNKQIVEKGDEQIANTSNMLKSIRKDIWGTQWN